MLEWGEVLLRALEAARRSGGLPWEETLHREVVAKLAMISVGIESELVRTGLDGIWADYVRGVTEEGEVLDDLRLEVSSIQAAGPRSVSPVRGLQLQRIRFVLREFAGYRERLSEDSRASLGLWERSLGLR
ncbi:hypothetical protein C8D88_102389 [Lentzea atacamensis]|uniref:Uncharacterized protein n=1 Tax=Lentzea atacamensis TaxID=531938 RepID=A0A316IFU5_9PSEU|nr:hypothetical protein C8D88_102389 [Lentzea atacamensis]RAS61838.1 hypothetical protein C8D87_109285 [Lentzea atacamensis]